MDENKKRQLEEDILQLIFKFGFENVEIVFEEMKPTIRERFEERMKTIPSRRDVLAKTGLASESALRANFVRAKTIFSSLPVSVEEEVIEPVEEVSSPIIEVCQQNVIIEPIVKGTNEKKKAQREAEKRMKEENEANGIFAADLLTEENLRTWKAARHSNAYIAREFVGCREEEVAKAIKKFGISNPAV